MLGNQIICFNVDLFGGMIKLLQCECSSEYIYIYIYMGCCTSVLFLSYCFLFLMLEAFVKMDFMEKRVQTFI